MAVTGINEIYEGLTTSASVPTSNISAAEANGVPSPVDNGKPASESAPEQAETLVESTEAVAPVSEATEEPAVEPKAEEKPTAKEASFSKRFAMAAQKEKELRQRELDLQKREQDLRQSATQPKQTAVNPLEGIDPKMQPLSALHRLGISIQDVQEAVLRGEKTPEVDPLEEKLKPFRGVADEVKALKEELARRDATSAQKDYENQVAGVKGEIAKEAANGYDLINSFGEFGVNTVFETMQMYYNQYNKVLQFKEACDIVESHFEEEFMPKLVASNKLKGKFASAVSAKTASEPSDKVKPDKKGPSTLTNSQSAMPSAKAPDLAKMGRDEVIDWLAKNVIKHQG